MSPHLPPNPDPGPSSIEEALAARVPAPDYYETANDYRGLLGDFELVEDGVPEPDPTPDPHPADKPRSGYDPDGRAVMEEFMANFGYDPDAPVRERRDEDFSNYDPATGRLIDPDDQSSLSAPG